MKWYLKVLRQYADFGGRARRTEYWMFALFNAIFAMLWIFVTMFAYGIAGGFDGYPEEILLTSWVLQLSYTIVFLLPSTAVAVRRLHDAGKSGWMLLVGLIPLVGWIWLLVLMITEGQPAANRYGPNPKTSGETFGEHARLKSAGVTLTVAAILTVLLQIFDLTARQLMNEAAPFDLRLIANFVVPALLLTAGIFLLRKKVRTMAILLLSTFGICCMQSVSVLRLTGQHVEWQFLFSNFAWIVFCLAGILFAASLLLPDRKPARIAAVWTVAVSIIYLLWSIYFRMRSFFGVDHIPDLSYVVYNLLNLFGILLPVALVVLANTFAGRSGTGVVAEQS
jgi:uncharacterized membrane protein YhaH (DUF805 family)